MTILKALSLAVLQGLTEFLPVSSSGHLALLNAVMPGGTADAAFFAVVHLGTMLATICVFAQEIAGLTVSLGGVGRGFRERVMSAQHKMILWIVVASIPTGIMGVILADRFEGLAENTKLVGAMLIITGVVLFLTKFVKAGEQDENNFGPLKSFLVGCAQGLAIMPGISRSGSTIAAAVFLKARRDFAGRFSFLISFPAIFAANLLELHKVGKAGNGVAVYFQGSFILGFCVAFGVGFLALKALLRLLKQGKFHYFSYYCFAIGLVAILFI